MPDATYWTLDSLPLGVWVGAVPGGEVVYVNQAFRQIVGMEAVTESRIEDVPVTYHVRDRRGQHFPVEKLPFARAVAELRPVTVDDMVLHRSDGRQVFLRAFALPKLDEHGAPAEVVVAFVDITREVTAEAQRDLVNTQLQLVVNHSPIAIWAADLDGTITLSEG
ncbi:MAG: PAS domain-containing protein, partial [Deltaproteobacteria bacterium]|nr:PAS domain-containing protein [Deltaproteobacteria bacterium]